jgi:hypothetical protein
MVDGKTGGALFALKAKRDERDGKGSRWEVDGRWMEGGWEVDGKWMGRERDGMREGKRMGWEVDGKWMG